MAAGESAGGWFDLGPGFIRRVLITTGWLGAVSFLCVASYVGIRPGASYLAGVIIGSADLFLLDALLREVIGPRRRWALALYGIAKFAVVYGVGAVLLLCLHLRAWYMLAGFSLFLLVILLKILGLLLLNTPAMSRERKGAGGPLLRDGPGRKKVARV